MSQLSPEPLQPTKGRSGSCYVELVIRQIAPQFFTTDSPANEMSLTSRFDEMEVTG
jgi:hypothetical protein